MDTNLEEITEGLESAVIQAITEEDQSLEILTSVRDRIQAIENCSVDNMVCVIIIITLL